jgi:MFS superfamily sulfate permease-like transporter
MMAAIPVAAVGALLVIAGADLALSRRLLEARRHCWPAIGMTAALTCLLNPAIGLLAGWAIEAGRSAASAAWSAQRGQRAGEGSDGRLR